MKCQQCMKRLDILRNVLDVLRKSWTFYETSIMYEISITVYQPCDNIVTHLSTIMFETRSWSTAVKIV